MSRSTPRRGGFSPLLVVLVIAVMLWVLFTRSQTAPESAPLSDVTPAAEATFDVEQPQATADATESTPHAAASPAAEQPAQVSVATIENTALASAPKPPKPTATSPRAPPAQIDGLPIITLDELPREARKTLDLIERDGPFPFSKDGATFQNREGLLPRKASGYYHEYTVITPGENDRGARRIVAGARDELYYTDDHYASFARIWMP
ncbi:ribonuclease domain-containing protein [Caldilinea sp.]|uniref:ribonuclease domain-containing protein n=1 Tax=Caldilinea sp. TaxID=2293560 RepID=UPI002D153BAC|nr:ribonuclease domain-containing protein [Caldilinea sp.]HRA65815.1 ribonuclease domain-containing protein [Caldilinea sp.]